jgi:hypothetical protein
MDFHGVSGAIPELSFVRYVETFPFQCTQGFESPRYGHATLHNKGNPAHFSWNEAAVVTHLYQTQDSTKWVLLGDM